LFVCLFVCFVWLVGWLVGWLPNEEAGEKERNVQFDQKKRGNNTQQ